MLNIPTTNNSPQYYDSEYYGEQIDEAVGQILSGEIEDYATRAEDAAEKAESATVHTPYINENANWMVWSTSTEKYVDSGKSSKGTKGDTGATGPQGPPGVVVDVGVGQFTLHINDEGHLIATINT